MGIFLYVLCCSVHAGSSESQELRDLQEMLKSQDITAAEKQSVSLCCFSRNVVMIMNSSLFVLFL